MTYHGSAVRAAALVGLYPLAAGYYRLRRPISTLRHRPAVLVYQMGKVGSTAVTASIRKALPGVPVYAVHTLTEPGVARMRSFYQSCGFAGRARGGHLLRSQHIMAQLRRGVRPGRWKVVTLVRDPVARNVSMLFQLGPRLVKDFERRCRTDTLDFVALTEELRRHHPVEIDCLSWFERELQCVFGVDIFATELPPGAGCGVYRGEIADVLLLKLEHAQRCASRAFAEFLGTRPFEMVRANVGADKPFGALYERFQRRLVLPDSYLDAFYETPEMRHLYSAAEIDGFRRRWGRRSGGLV